MGRYVKTKFSRKKFATGNTPALRAANTGTINGSPNVQYKRNELVRVLDQYRRIVDCIAGSEAVKARGQEYLPMPNAADQSDANVARYQAYIERAVFYAVTFRTVHALVGQIFLRDPQIELPTSFDTLQLDCNGENVPLNGVAKAAARHTLSIGRAGLHVDYTSAPKGATRADIDSGDYRPIITEYSGESVINWRKARRGARMVYTLIVVEEEWHMADDGFEVKSGSQYKVMRLVSAQDAQNALLTADPDNYGDLWDGPVTNAISSSSDVYMMEVWRSDTNTNAAGSFGIAEVYYPKGDDGEFLNEIPWTFIGSETNDDSVDQPPMSALAEINLAHYRNSADYEESVFLIGQPTPYVSGVTEEWNQNVLKGSIQLGSRGVIPLPNGGTAGLLQADPNTLAFEAMGQKERQMVALGAKLVEQREVQRTATEAEMEGTADTSILAQIAQNVSDAMQWALKTACKFTGDNPDSVTYTLNKEFDLTSMPADARQQLLLEFQADMITEEEMRANLRRAGIATLDDATFATQIKVQKAARMADALALAKASQIQTKPTLPGQPAPPPPGSGGNSPGNTPRPGAKPGSNPAPKPKGT